ncbi:MAG TPA: carbohydrate-binding domain-containing protein [Desulfuromonadaceae bacterium]|nr:carbohydrate-binding domain-containing protein [Desulfuromonadaceae bacterium]
MKSNYIKRIVTVALACGVSLAARAQVGSGWAQYFPGMHVQKVGNVSYSSSGGTETFSINGSDSSSEQRCEERVEDDFSSGTRQFEGFVKVTSLGGSGISLKQTFQANNGAFLMVAIKSGSSGTLYDVHSGTTLATGVIGVSVRVNTVTDCGANKSYEYINGSLKNTISGGTAPFYNKYGTYRLGSGSGPIKAQWSGIRFWQGGSISGGGGGGTTVSFEAENLAVADSGTGHSTQTDANSSNGAWVSLDAENAGSWIEFTTGTVQAGTYSISMMWKGNNNRGISDFFVDGTQLGGTVDQYSSAQTYPTTTFGTRTFSSSGTHKIRMHVVGKNSSSSSYVLSADKFTFTAQ